MPKSPVTCGPQDQPLGVLVVRAAVESAEDLDLDEACLLSLAACASARSCRCRSCSAARVRRDSSCCCRFCSAAFAFWRCWYTDSS
ncbi:hypothetical protein [Streptomyces roseolilacinus]|uniref:hypothetical protein n=1 Tax=Streptomyces roseolilacinus TaxID=66904 RepID=UPI0016776B9F|nr:hypothetical protein [Streptomyces roseolilacinus]